LRAQASRKLKAGQLLGAGGLLEEARDAVCKTISYLGQALAVEQHLPEPADLEAVVQAPWQILWGEQLSLIELFLNDGTRPWEPVAADLHARLEAGNPSPV